MHQVSKNFLVLAALICTACSMGSSIEDSNLSKRLADQDAVTRQYKELEGVYRGTMTPDNPIDPPQDVELSVYLATEVSGKDDKGAPTTQVVPRATYLRIGFPRQTALPLAIQYEPRDNNRLSMSNTPNGTPIGNIYFSVTGRFDGNSIQGNVYDYKGFYGTLLVTRE